MYVVELCFSFFSIIYHHPSDVSHESYKAQLQYNATYVSTHQY